MKSVMIAAAAVAAGAAVLSANVSVAKELKFASFVSPKYALHKPIFLKLGEDVKKETGGKLTIRVYPSGELGRGPAEQYKRAATRIADFAMSVTGYTSSLFPRNLMIELPGVTKSNTDATEKLWKIMDKHLRQEFRRTIVIGNYTTMPAVLMMRTKPIRTPADLNGMKIRVPSRMAGSVIAAYGGTPVQMPANKVYTALSTGVIDGVLMGPSGLSIFKLAEPSRYVTYGLPAMVTSIFIAMNEQAFNELPKDQQAAIRKHSGKDLSMRAAKVLHEAGTRDLKRFGAEKGKQLIKIDAASFAKFNALAKKAIAAEVKRLEGRNIKASQILADLKK